MIIVLDYQSINQSIIQSIIHSFIPFHTLCDRLGEVLISHGHHHILLKKALGEKHPENIIHEEENENHHNHLQTINANSGNTAQRNGHTNEVVVDKRSRENPQEENGCSTNQRRSTQNYAKRTERKTPTFSLSWFGRMISPILEIASSTCKYHLLSTKPYKHTSMRKTR